MLFEVDYCAAAYSYAIKAVCDRYDFSQDDLLFLRQSHSLAHSKSDCVHFICRIPIWMPWQVEMLPLRDAERGLIRMHDNAAMPNGGLYDRYKTGLREFKFYDPRQKEVPLTERNFVRFWTWQIEFDDHPLAIAAFVEKKNAFKLRRYSMLVEKNSELDLSPPILPTGMLNEIYKNTIGFLKNGRQNKELYQEFSIAYKRGILLCGNPGSGKTMTCKWLRNLAIKNNLYYRVVTSEEYENAKMHGSVGQLFTPPKKQPAIIFFDDMDIMVKSRASGNTGIMPFLTHMDGIFPAEGVVFVFTTNVVEELDEAFVRPGRIDLWIPFTSPNEKLRRQFVEMKFQQKILDQVDFEFLISKTVDFSFAELEEVRKLFAFDLMDNKTLNTEKTLELFSRHRDEFRNRERFGLNQIDTNNDWEDETPVFGFPGLPPFNG